MKFQITTDYAIRIMLYLHQHRDESNTAKTISSELGITYQYFMKVINRLKKAKLVTTIQGCNGGYMLSQHVNNLSLYDIIQIMEGELQINNCLGEEGYCSRGGISYCKVHEIFVNLQSELIEKLEGIKLDDLVKA